MLDLILKNGTVVNFNSTLETDLGIKDGKIVIMGDSKFFPESQKTIDAKEKHVMPGMIDSHVHINLKMGEFTTLDSFHNASLAAAYGGTTTIVEFAIPYENETPLAAVERRIQESSKNTVINYSFHGCVVKGNKESYQSVEELITGGIPTIKMFTVYKDIVMVGKGEILEVLKIIRNKGGLAKFHAESADIIDYQIESFIQRNKTSTIYHAKSRPSIAEYEAMSSLLPLIEFTEAPSLFVHMSTQLGAQSLSRYRDKLPIFTEVCPHYLILNEKVYEKEDGQNYICSPPIRSEQEKDGLWRMIKDGLVDIVNSDHCCYDTYQKEKYNDYFPKAPNGLPGIETRGITFFSEGVAKEKISVNRFVEMTSTNVAKLMGMFPQKGLIGIGSDADIVIFDGNITYPLTTNDLHMQTNYTPFEGLKITGKPIHTIINGQHVIEDGKLINSYFRGEFVKRSQPILS